MRLVAEELAHTGVDRHRVVDQSARGEVGHEVMQIGKPEEQVHFGDFLLELPSVAFDEAADRHDGFDVPFPLEPRGAEDGVDRLLFGRVDEPTGVDEDHVGRGQIASHDRAVPHELPDDPFRIDRRLVAAERDDAELHPR